MSVEDINKITLLLLEKKSERKAEEDGDDNQEANSGSTTTTEGGERRTDDPSPSLERAVIVGATCCPVMIPYPTDLRLIYESILKLCEIRKDYGEVSNEVMRGIDRGLKEAKKLYHSFTLRKKKPRGGLKRMTQQMFKRLEKTIKGFFKQFEKSSTACLDALSERKKRYLLTILKVYEQQSGKAYRGKKIQGRIAART